MPTLHRPALALGFALGALLAISPSCSGSSGGGSGGGAGGGSGVGGGGGSSGNDAAAFCNDFSNAYCDYGVRCGFVTAAGKAECATYFRNAFCGLSVQLASKGYQSFDPALGKTCLSALQAITCESPDNPLFTTCDKLFTPNSPTNGGCVSPDDCKNTATESCGGAVCSRTCQPAGMMGQPCPRTGNCAAGFRCDATTNLCSAPATIGGACTPFGASQCDGTSYCDSATRKCVALPTSGQTCRLSTPQCTNGFFCSANTCQAKLAQGITCPGSGSCQDALFCNTALTPDSCQTRLAEGVACPITDSCAGDLRCIGGSCVKQRTAGQSCNGTSDCTFDLQCDPVLKACTASVYDLAVDQPCTSYARDCQSPLRCKGYAVSPTGGIGTIGTCAAPKVGDSCAYRGSSECPTASFCNLAVDGGPGTCVAGSVGTPCSSYRECKATDYCESSLCAPRKASGGTCVDSNSCVSPLSCIDAPTGTTKSCGKLGELGAACFAGDGGTSNSNNCIFPLVCTGTTCQHAGGLGEKCLSGIICITGSCPRDGGVCQPPAVEGTTCIFSSECASGRCINGKCEMTCP